MREVMEERDESRAEVERLRAELSALRVQRATERARDGWAEVERLRGALTAVVPQRRANQSCVEGREVVDADWLLENWCTLRDEEELLCTVGGVRRWLGVVLCDALTGRSINDAESDTPRDGTE